MKWVFWVPIDRKDRLRVEGRRAGEYAEGKGHACGAG